MEIWKNALDGYQVSNKGNVRSVKGNEPKILSTKLRKGYLLVQLYVQGRRIYRSIHKLVANTFIPNCDGKPQVNHINGCKTDNRVENLEWCTASENQRHRFDVLGKCNTGKRVVLCKELHEKYSSVKDASLKSKVDSSAIVRCCRGKQKTAGGYHWEYV